MISKSYQLFFFIILCIFLTSCQGTTTWEQYQGGIHVVLKTESNGNPTIDDQNTNKIAQIIDDRLKAMGYKNRIIQVIDNNNIVIQLPKQESPDKVVSLISTSAILEFKLVDDENKLEEALKGNIPVEDEILYQIKKTHDRHEKIPFLLKKQAVLTGEYLTDAKMNITQFDTPYITLTFNDQGARIFEKVTATNINKQLAIILDGVVYSAPIIMGKIPDGRAQISGIFSKKVAADFAIILRVGRFPVKAKLIEYKQLDKESWLGDSNPIANPV